MYGANLWKGSATSMDDGYLYGDEDEDSFAFARPADSGQIEEVEEGESDLSDEDYEDDGEYDREEDAANQGFVTWLRSSVARMSLGGTIKRAAARTLATVKAVGGKTAIYTVTSALVLVVPAVAVSMLDGKASADREIYHIAVGKSAAEQSSQQQQLAADQELMRQAAALQR